MNFYLSDVKAFYRDQFGSMYPYKSIDWLNIDLDFKPDLVHRITVHSKSRRNVARIAFNLSWDYYKIVPVINGHEVGWSQGNFFPQGKYDAKVNYYANQKMISVDMTLREGEIAETTGQRSILQVKFWANKSLEEDIYLYMTVEVLEADRPDERQDER